MPRPCQCDHVQVGSQYDATQCHRCWLWHHVPAYRAKHGTAEERSTSPIVAGTSPGSLALACRFRGEPTGEEVLCDECGSRHKLLSVRACSVHERCTENVSVDRRLQSCKKCKERESPFTEQASPPGTLTLDLAYHVYPLPGTIWRWNLQQLKDRWSLFTGRKVVAIAVDSRTEPADRVREELAGRQVEFVEVANDPELREVVSWMATLARLRCDDQARAIFFAHAKGVTHAPEGPVRQWTQALYEVMLDYWPLGQRLLAGHPVVGSFLKEGIGWSPDVTSSSWHFAGGFALARSQELFRRKWTGIDHFKYGTETYWSRHFPLEEVGCMFYRGPAARMNLYESSTWEHVQPALERWKNDHRALRRMNT